MKRPFALKSKNMKSASLKDEALNLKDMEEKLEQKIKLCKTIQSKYKKLIECEEKKKILETELSKAINNYETKIEITKHEKPEDFLEAIKNIAGQA